MRKGECADRQYKDAVGLMGEDVQKTLPFQIRAKRWAGGENVEGKGAS